MREALERQKEFDPTITDGDATVTTTTSEDHPSHRSHLRDAEEEMNKNEVLSSETNSWTEKEEKHQDLNVEESKVKVQETSFPVKEKPVSEPAPEEKKDEESEAERPWRSYHREQVISSIYIFLNKSCIFFICMN